MKIGKKFFFLLTLFITVLFYPFDAAAVMASAQLDMETAVEPEPGAESESDAEQVPEPGVEPEAEQPAESAAGPDSVSTGAELMGWMESHKDTGGSVKLTDNIVLDGSHILVLAGSAPTEHVFVETAGHTITVAGTVEFWSNAHLTFRGGANEYGIFHVQKGGMLSLNGVSVENGQYGEERPSETALHYALWQEEGAGLIVCDCQISGNIHYANTPFVMYKNSTYAIVEKEQTAGDVLPSEIKCTVNYQGQVNHNKPVQVTWDLTGTKEAQEKRLRFQIQGSFFHAASEVPPVCAVVYNDHPLTFTEVEARMSNGFYVFQGGYTKPEEFLSMTLVSEYSFDGVNWFVDDEEKGTDALGTFFIGIQSEGWNTEEHPYLYIRLQGEYGGVVYFSNVLRYAADNLETAEDCGGDRGGETSIVNLSDTPQKEHDNAPLDSEGAPEGSAGDKAVAEAKPEESADDGAGAVTKPEENADDGTGAVTKPEGSADDGAGAVTKPEENVVNKAGAGAKPEGSADDGAGTDTKPEGSADDGTGADTKPEGSADDGTGAEAKPEGSADDGIGADTKPESSTGGSVDENTADSKQQTLEHRADHDDAGTEGSGTSLGTNTVGGKTSLGTYTSEVSSSANAAGGESTSGTVSKGTISRTSESAEQNIRQSRTIVIVLGFVVLSAIAGAAGFCFHAGVYRRLIHTVSRFFK